MITVMTKFVWRWLQGLQAIRAPGNLRVHRCRLGDGSAGNAPMITTVLRGGIKAGITPADGNGVWTLGQGPQVGIADPLNGKGALPVGIDGDP